MDEGRTLPEEVISEFMDHLPDGAYMTGAVVIATYLVPGEEDDDERGPFLAWRCDGQAGRWTHLGMCETASNDMRADLRERDDDA